MKIARHIDQLGERIKQLRIDYERFFNGALLAPPLELQDRIAGALRRLREVPSTSLVDQFRLTQLEARFNSYRELNTRRLREQEEGRTAGGAAAEPERLDPRRGVVVGDQLPAAVVEALYAGLCNDGRAPRFDLDSFRTYLDRQAAAIRSQSGCDEVRFRVVDEGGQTKLKALPIRPPEDAQNGGPVS